MPTFKTKFPHMSKGASVSEITLAFNAAMEERAERAGLQVDGTSWMGIWLRLRLSLSGSKTRFTSLASSDTLMDLAVRLEPATFMGMPNHRALVVALVRGVAGIGWIALWHE